MLKLLNEASYPQIMVLLREKLQHQGKPYKQQDMLEISHLFKGGCKARRKELSWKHEKLPVHISLCWPQRPEQERWSSLPAHLLTSVAFATEADTFNLSSATPTISLGLLNADQHFHTGLLNADQHCHTRP